MADELDDVAEPEDLEDLDETLDDDGLEDEQVEDEDVDELVEEDVEVAKETPEEVDSAEPGGRVATEEAEEDEEEEPDDEDVEASLDVILKERLVVEDEPEDEESRGSPTIALREPNGSGPSSPTSSCAAPASWSSTRANWPTRPGCSAGTACEGRSPARSPTGGLEELEERAADPASTRCPRPPPNGEETPP